MSYCGTYLRMLRLEVISFTPVLDGDHAERWVSWRGSRRQGAGDRGEKGKVRGEKRSICMRMLREITSKVVQ